MTLPLVNSMLALLDTSEPDITQVFHSVNNVLPEEQEMVWFSFDTPVSKALAQMKELKFSQVPIKARDRVLGIFSYRSFSNRMAEFGGEKIDLTQLSVGDCIEAPEYVYVLGDLEQSLAALDRNDVVLIGTNGDLKGLLTPIDLVKYLYRLSSPFILFDEIEHALRAIIHMSTSPEQLHDIVAIALAGIYAPNNMPNSLEDMTFNDYAQLIGDGRGWLNFQDAFGYGDLKRKLTRTKLKKLGELRNEAFHFRRQLDLSDIQTLVAHRDWIKAVATAFQAKRGPR